LIPYTELIDGPGETITPETTSVTRTVEVAWSRSRELLATMMGWTTTSGNRLSRALPQQHSQRYPLLYCTGADLLSAYAPTTTAVQLNLLGSHDTPRALSLLGGDVEAMELAVLLQATLPGAPCVYYGDEVGLTGGKDPDSRKAFPWDPARWEADLLHATRATFALRRAEPALRSDGVTILAAASGALAFERRAGERRLAVALNAGDAGTSLHLGAGGAAEVMLATGRGRLQPPRLRPSDGALTVDLPPRAGVVIDLG